MYNYNLSLPSMEILPQFNFIEWNDVFLIALRATAVFLGYYTIDATRQWVWDGTDVSRLFDFLWSSLDTTFILCDSMR